MVALVAATRVWLEYVVWLRCHTRYGDGGSVRPRPIPESMMRETVPAVTSTLWLLACSDTGTVIVRTPWS
jgi:hypothetical protein